jgi:hypothetical protein
VFGDLSRGGCTLTILSRLVDHDRKRRSINENLWIAVTNASVAIHAQLLLGLILALTDSSVWSIKPGLQSTEQSLPSTQLQMESNWAHRKVSVI